LICSSSSARDASAASLSSCRLLSASSFWLEAACAASSSCFSTAPFSWDGWAFCRSNSNTFWDSDDVTLSSVKRSATHVSIIGATHDYFTEEKRGIRIRLTCEVMGSAAIRTDAVVLTLARLPEVEVEQPEYLLSLSLTRLPAQVYIRDDGMERQ
jgi:hypothetical protein